MKLYFAEVNEGAAIDAAKLDALVDGAESHMQTYCGTDSAAGNTTTPTVIEMDTEKLCRNFVMAADPQATSHWELHFEEHAHRRRLSGEDVFVAIFAEHDLHAEFESTASGHYLTTAAGVDVECREYEGAFHAFVVLPFVADAKDAWAFVRSRLRVLL